MTLCHKKIRECVIVLSRVCLSYDLWAKCKSQFSVPFCPALILMFITYVVYYGSFRFEQIKS